MAARKIRDAWWVDFRHAHVRYRKRSPQNSKGGAAAYEAELRQKLASGEPFERAKAAAPPTFAQFSADWLRIYVQTNNKPSEQRRKVNTLKSHLLPFFGSLTLDKVCPKIIEEYKSSRLRLGLKAKTINNHLTVLHKALDTAVEWNVLPCAPRMKFLKTEPPPFTYLSVAEAGRLVEHIDEPLWRAMILTALKTGLRYHELIALEWPDVDFENGTIRVLRGNVAGHVSSNKVNRVRHLPFTSDVRRELQGLFTRRTCDLVFSRGQSYVRHDLARRRIARFCAEAGVPQVCWHALRHTYASHLVGAGATVKAVQDLLGHASINMTMRYSHLNDEQLRDTVSLLEPKNQTVWATGGQREHLSTEMSPASQVAAVRLEGSA